MVRLWLYGLHSLLSCPYISLQTSAACSVHVKHRNHQWNVRVWNSAIEKAYSRIDDLKILDSVLTIEV
jgi:endonuclease/exonuclease/phosphatase (EEP) superfamily protein YafD